MLASCTKCYETLIYTCKIGRCASVGRGCYVGAAAGSPLPRPRSLSLRSLASVARSSVLGCGGRAALRCRPSPCLRSFLSRFPRLVPSLVRPPPCPPPFLVPSFAVRRVRGCCRLASLGCFGFPSPLGVFGGVAASLRSAALAFRLYKMQKTGCFVVRLEFLTKPTNRTKPTH